MDPKNLDSCFYGSSTVGQRGQIVVPAEAREALGIAPGDKVLIMKKPDMPGLVVAKFESLRMLLDEMSAGLDAVNAQQPAEAGDED